MSGLDGLNCWAAREVAARVRRRLRVDCNDRGSTVPLILGFFVVALMFAAAAVMASDAFTRQRDLQSICDGAATAAASSADFSAIRGGLDAADALPLGQVQESVDDYLSRDPERANVTASAEVDSAEEVSVNCSQRSKLAFAAMFGSSAGITQHASANARAPLA